MKPGMKFLFAFALLLCSFGVFAQEGRESGANLAAQSAADVLRDFAGADGAFIAAAQLKDSYQKDNLATLVEHPTGTDEVVIVSLTGAQIKQAFERSLSLYPQPNASFLQISGFEVQFNKGAAPGQRVTGVTAGGSKLDEGRTYQIAMPSTLGRGGMGYFKIWDKAKIVKTFNTTVEEVLKGKRYSDSSPRWSASG
jgi:2',3'-cyclic-nucleotide 2'-phosphodiesterase (5'-nucleotidase family)